MACKGLCSNAFSCTSAPTDKCGSYRRVMDTLDKLEFQRCYETSKRIGNFLGIMGLFSKILIWLDLYMIYLKNSVRLMKSPTEQHKRRSTNSFEYTKLALILCWISCWYPKAFLFEWENLNCNFEWKSSPDWIWRVGWTESLCAISFGTCSEMQSRDEWWKRSERNITRVDFLISVHVEKNDFILPSFQ